MKRKAAGRPEPAAPARRVETLPVRDIALRPEFQVRKNGTYDNIARQYADKMRAGVEFPPVLVADIKGVLTLVDGWHRVEAAKAVGRRDIEAEIVVVTLAEARWMAANANMAHGVPLDRRDHVNIFQAFVKAGRHRTAEGGFKSYREIAKELGAIRGHTTLRQWMQRHFPGVAQRMSGETPSDSRGEELRDPVEAHQQTLTNEITAALVNVRALAKGIQDPDFRGLVLAELKEALAEIAREGEANEPWL